jgi:hypothetical protein
MFHPFLTLSPQARSFGEEKASSSTSLVRKVTFRAPLLNEVREAQRVAPPLPDDVYMYREPASLFLFLSSHLRTMTASYLSFLAASVQSFSKSHIYLVLW